MSEDKKINSSSGERKKNTKYLYMYKFENHVQAYHIEMDELRNKLLNVKLILYIVAIVDLIDLAYRFFLS